MITIFDYLHIIVPVWAVLSIISTVLYMNKYGDDAPALSNIIVCSGMSVIICLLVITWPVAIFLISVISIVMITIWVNEFLKNKRQVRMKPRYDDDHPPYDNRKDWI